MLSSESELYIYSDYPKNEAASAAVREVREYIKTVNGFKKVEIIYQEKNLGLAKSIVSGVTEIVQRFGKVIVLEDDLVTSPYFLTYMNDALDIYENDDQVACIHGYTYPIKNPVPETFFLKGADCWGWGTWKRAWELYEPDGQILLDKLVERKLEYEFNFDGSYPYIQMLRDQIAGLNDSWAIRWYASAFLKNKLTLYPGKSLVQNIGNDGTGTHSSESSRFKVDLNMSRISVRAGARPSSQGYEAFVHYLKSFSPKKSKLSKLLRKLTNLFR
jgi:hypothetical protein